MLRPAGPRAKAGFASFLPINRKTLQNRQTSNWKSYQIRLIASLSRGVIPCAAQRVTVRCRHGILKGAGVCYDPVSAQRHFMPQRARDDGPELFNRIRYHSVKSIG